MQDVSRGATYRTLEEQEGKLSAAEQRFGSLRHRFLDYRGHTNSVTAVLGLCLCVALGVADGDTVFAAFSSSTIFLFIGSFIIAEAMMVHGLDRRFAFRILSARGVAQSTYRTTVGFGVIALLLSAFISNTAAAAMLFPIGRSTGPRFAN